MVLAVRPQPEELNLADAAGLGGGEPQDLPGCAFMGTIIHQGVGGWRGGATGTGTAFGQIAAGVAEKHAQTAFEVGLSRFSRFCSRWRPR